MTFNNQLFSDFFKSFRHLFTSEERDKNLNKSKSLWGKLRIWITLIFGISLFLILISLISLKDLLFVFSNFNLGYFLAAFVVGISGTVIKTIRYGSFYPAPGRCLKLYGVFTLLRFIYYLLPFNAGEFVYLTVLKKYKFSPTITETIPTWVFIRMTDVIALTMWFVLTITFSHLSGNLFNEMYHLRWIFIGISLVFIAFMFSLPLWISKISLGKSSNWFSRKLDLLKAGFVRMLGVSVFFRTILISMIIWGALIGWHVLAQSAYNIPLELWQKILISITIYFLSLVPINTPLNIGTDEAAWTAALMMSGVVVNQAISIAISMRIISMLILMTDGLIGFSLLFLRRNSDSTSNPL